MISVEEAAALVNKNLGDFGEESIPLTECVNRVLAEDIFADRDFPPFDRVMMDGIAINYKAWSEGVRNFEIEGVMYAGSPVIPLNNYKNCVEVMTGAMLPINTDTVIRYEDFTVDNNVANIDVDQVQQGKNVHGQGLDKRSDDLLMSKGIQISPAEIALLASVGKTEVKVKRLPTVAVISSGDELVEVHETPADHQIRKSNVYAIHGALAELKIAGDLNHMVDEQGVMKVKMKGLLANNDVLILSGGVSKGKKDYIPGILADLGVEKFFHRVKQRPGKPFWFGKTASGKFVFAFPGNPVSTYMCFYRYFVPWLGQSLGLKLEENRAVLSEDYTFKPEVTYFLQVALSNSEGQIVATPITGKGSGDFANLSLVDAFLELPANKADFRKGELLPLFRFRGGFSK